MLARHEVGPHWNRQAYGPRHSRRRWIVVERYKRGPAPEEDQIVLTRLAERQARGGDAAEDRPPGCGANRRGDDGVDAEWTILMHAHAHASLKGRTPAMAALLAGRPWTLDDIVTLIEERTPRPGPRGPYRRREKV